MSWTSGKPLEGTWGDKELYRFLREMFTRLKFDNFTWNPPSVGATTSVDTTLTSVSVPQLAGLRAGMSVAVTPPSTLDAGLTCNAWVATDDTLTIRLTNVTAGAIDPSSGTWAFFGTVN